LAGFLLGFRAAIRSWEKLSGVAVPDVDADSDDNDNDEKGTQDYADSIEQSEDVVETALEPTGGIAVGWGVKQGGVSSLAAGGNSQCQSGESSF